MNTIRFTKNPHLPPGTGSFKSKIGDILTIEAPTPTTRGKLEHQALMAMTIAAMAIPGYLFSIAFIEKIGYKRLQLGGEGDFGKQRTFVKVSILGTGLR
jgi:hypothetical protein